MASFGCSEYEPEVAVYVSLEGGDSLGDSVGYGLTSEESWLEGGLDVDLPMSMWYVVGVHPACGSEYRGAPGDDLAIGTGCPSETSYRV